MNHSLTRAPYLLGRLIFFLALLVSIANAQNEEKRFVISKSPNFETFDQAYASDDTLYIQINLPDLDYFNIEDAEFVLKPARGSDRQHIAGDFENNLDGFYTAKLALNQTDPTIFEWQLKFKVKDNSGIEFSLRLPITIGEDNGDHSDDERLIEVEGRIRQITGDSLFVRDIWVVVTDTTAIFDENQTAFAFTDLALGQEVKVGAFQLEDGSLIAKFIKVSEKPEIGDHFEVEGQVTDLVDSTFVVDGVRFHVTPETEFIFKERNDANFDSLAVDMYVKVKGEVLDEQTLIAVRVIILGEEERDNRFEVRGPIESISDSSITVAGLEFLLREDTELRGDDDHFDIGLPALRKGLLVEIHSIKVNYAFWAVRIKLEEPPGTEVEIEGEIEALGDSFLVVDGQDFHVTDETVILDSDRNRIRFDVLEVGMNVKVKGLELPDLRLFALRVRVRKEARDRLKKEGKIEALTNNSLTVLGTTFQVDSTTQIVEEEQNQLLFSDLQVDLFVRVRGYLTSDGNAFAEEILVKSSRLEDVEVRAAIDSLGEDFIFAADLGFVISDRTIILDADRNHITFADLTVGMFVGIKGKRLPNGVNIALLVRVKNQDASEVEIRGTLTRIDGDTVVVEDTKFLARPTTDFFDSDETVLLLSDFVVGNLVEVNAIRDENGQAILQRMKREEAASISGAIEDANGGISTAKPGDGGQQLNGVIISQFNLLSTTVLVDDNTLVVGALNTILDANVLAAGALVDVQGTLTVNGELLASTVSVIEQAVITSVSGPNGEALPSTFELASNFPNPFNPSTTLRYTLAGESSQRVVLNIYNILGQRVVTIVNEIKPAGTYSAVWNGRDLAGRQVSTGIYIARLVVGDQARVRRMLLSK